MGQDREDERLREGIAGRARPPRAEDDPDFQARRQAADRKAERLRRRFLLLALLCICSFQLVGLGIALIGLHVRGADLGWALVWIGMFVGDAGAILGVWWLYLRRERRGDW